LGQRLAEAIRDAEALLPQLQSLLPEPDARGPRTGTIGRHVPESSPPWNSAAADAYWNLWHGPGVLINYLRGELGMHPLTDPPRGAEGLAALRDLTTSVVRDVQRTVLRKLERWADLARRIPAIDESEPWVPVPAVPDSRPPTCPYCGTFGLRMQRRRGQVRCTMPGCTDGEGNSTRARMEPGRMSGEARLVFGDGMMLHWAGRTETDDDGDGESAA
jgi:hypothetical protein